MNFKPLIPFEPVSTQDFPAGDQWIAQVKWDGVRMLTYYDGAAVKLINRRLNERTMQYPELLEAKKYCKAQSFILDGELIAFDQNKPAFGEIMKRDSLRNEQRIKQAVKLVPVVYMVFDLLYCNGEWTVDQPLLARQQLLQKIMIPGEHVQVVPNVSDAALLLQLMEERGMEGIVLKDTTSSYLIGGKDKRWLKRKLLRDLYAVAGGVTYRGSTVNSLLLGLYDEQGALHYIGHAGTGKVTQEGWRQLTRRAEGLLQKNRPFVGEPERSQEAVWIEPQIVVKVEYLEWTRGGTLRHPSIQAFVDMNPADCRLEQ